MKIFLKIFRNGLGALIALISWLIPTNKVKRSLEDQKAVDSQTQNIELYQFFACPFCIKTRRTIRKLNLKIVTRNAQSEGVYRSELLSEGGKIQVPCLKITENDKITWMYETAEIATYLEKRFG